MADAEPSKGSGQGRQPSKLRWLLGWIVLPGALISALFLTGVHFGARNPERPVARLLLKLIGGKPGVAAAIPSEPESETDSLHAPRPGAAPGESIRFSATLSPERLATIADKLMTPVAELECEDLCWAIDKTQDNVALYSVDRCALGRGPWTLASVLVCHGTSERTGERPGEQTGERANTDEAEPSKASE
jgi:hypothetical protein